MEMLDQFRGCLLGLACGAAPRAAAGTMRQGGLLPQRTGQSPAETHQMLCVLESYADCGGFDPHDIAERLLGWYRLGPEEISGLTREACENLLYGYHFERAGYDAWLHAPEGERWGGDSLARTVPAGLLHYHDNIHLIGESRVISGITHYDERCKLSCAVLNLALAHLLLVGVDGLLDELLEWAEPRNTVVGYSLRAIPQLSPRELRCGGDVLEVLPAALWAVMYCDEFTEGLALLRQLGGAEALRCAVGGALLGARFGAGAIPPDWLAALELQGRIEHGAQRLYAMAMGE